jgi:hypothetical protein
MVGKMSFSNIEKYQTVKPRPGFDAMTTIFCDFQTIFGKKLAFFSRTNVMIKLLHNLALF